MSKEKETCITCQKRWRHTLHVKIQDVLNFHLVLKASSNILWCFLPARMSLYLRRFPPLNSYDTRKCESDELVGQVNKQGGVITSMLSIQTLELANNMDGS